MALAWITGAKGFIGQHLSRHLADKGTAVYGIGHGAWPEERAQRQGISFWINGEIDSANLWQLLQKGGKPDVVYHLAGGSSVGFSMQSPQENFHRTVTSTATLLEWLRCFSPQTRIVAVSSAAVYGNAPDAKLKEDGSYTPFSPYGYHKKLVELLCESYVHSFGLKATVLRLFSIYGPGLKKQLLWDTCNKLAHRPEKLVLQGTGKELRDWLVVDDAVRLLAAAGAMATPEFAIINGGTGTGTSVSDIVHMLCKAYGHVPKISFSGQQRPGDPARLIAEISNTKRLGVAITSDLATEIASYVVWHKSGQRQP
jgi:UDP-glucose 4-epimerase